MSADVPRSACLQCEQTREEVRINRTICGSDFTPTHQNAKNYAELRHPGVLDIRFHSFSDGEVIE